MITSLFAGFNKAVRSMQQAQFALSVHSTNIAHANDKTYTRKDVLPPSETRLNGPGVIRLRDAFIDDQYRLAAGSLGEAEVRQNALSKVEDIFGDPVEGGLRKAIDQFYDAWQGLAENPSDGVARLQVISAGNTFAQQVNHVYTSLKAVEQTTNEELSSRVEEVNTALKRIFDLNKRISDMTRQHLDDAELRDQRDDAMDRLAKLTGAVSVTDPDGQIRVAIGSAVVVDGPTVMNLRIDPNTLQPVWGSTGFPYTGTGVIKGLVSVRDNEIKQLKSDIDTLARKVAETVNTRHAAGFKLGGGAPPDFFRITPAPAGIQVNPDLKAEDIAAAADSSGLPSDGDNARQLAALADVAILNSVIIPGQVQSPRIFYRNLVGWVGTRASDATQAKETAHAHAQVGELQRQAAWGVSIDEEVANLSMQQRAFAAAARIITVIDEMMDTLINRT